MRREDLRAAREARGLSRRELAEMAETTTHHVWTCEMPPYAGKDEICERIVAILSGQSPGAETPTRRDGMVEWYCPKCDQTQTQPAAVTTVLHKCTERSRPTQMIRRG